MVVSTLKAARKRTGEIRSNLHTGQYTGSISPGHSQGQTLVEPLELPGVTRHLNKFLHKTTQKRGSGLAIHTSGLELPLVESGNCFGGRDILAFCGRRTRLSGGVFIVALSKSVHNRCVPHQAQASLPGAQSRAIRPPSIISQANMLQSGGETNAGQ